jgi:hypothetical protein
VPLDATKVSEVVRRTYAIDTNDGEGNQEVDIGEDSFSRLGQSHSILNLTLHDLVMSLAQECGLRQTSRLGTATPKRPLTAQS